MTRVLGVRVSLRLATLLLVSGIAVASAAQGPTKAPTRQTTPGQTTPKRVAPAPAAGARPTTPARRGPLLVKADAAREAGDLEAAVGLYQKVVAQSPRNAEAWWYLGTTLYDLERWADARRAFDRVVRMDAQNGAATAFRGLCTFKLGDYADALVDLLQAKALGVSGNAEVGSVARFHAGLAMTRLGQFEVALNTLGEFALEGNDSPQIIEALGIATLRLPLLPSEVPPEKREMVLMAGRGSYFMAMRLAPAARTAFEELTLRYPEVPHVHYAFAVFLLTDDPDRAIREFERELAIQPGHATSHVQIAGEYLKRGDAEKARPHAEKAIALAPTDFIAHRLMGQVALEAGDVPAAIASLEQSRTLEPNSPSVYFTLAKAYARAGRDADAEKARAEFTRLDRLSRLQRHGQTSVGGVTPQ
jgi:tetratricopeptide (TPR) repeat protein